MKGVCFMKQKTEIFLDENINKIGIRNAETKEVIVDAIYDFDNAIYGSYYIDPDYVDNYYLYRFRDNYAIFKLGNKVCVYDTQGKLIEQPTSNIEQIVEKYYYGAKNYWESHGL